MDARNIVMDLRVWIVGGTLLALVFPTLDVPASAIIVAVLMVQMTLSLDGLKVTRGDISGSGRDMLLAMVMCYLINTGLTLLCGVLFISQNEAIWYGWVMLACMPCAISVVTAAILMHESITAALTAVTATYVAGIGITPLLSFALIGDAADPGEILKYILLFILIPLVFSRLIRPLHLSRDVKLPLINCMMGLSIFISVNANIGFIWDYSYLVLAILVLVVFRVLALQFISAGVVKWMHQRGDRMRIFVVLGVWKNTGLSISMTMVLLSAVQEAVIPCVMCMIVESLWFSLYTRTDGIAPTTS